MIRTWYILLCDGDTTVQNFGCYTLQDSFILDLKRMVKHFGRHKQGRWLWKITKELFESMHRPTLHSVVLVTTGGISWQSNLQSPKSYILFELGLNYCWVWRTYTYFFDCLQKAKGMCVMMMLCMLPVAFKHISGRVMVRDVILGMLMAHLEWMFPFVFGGGQKQLRLP